MGIFEGMEKKKALEAQLLDIYKHVQFWIVSFNFCVNTTFENPFFFLTLTCYCIVLGLGLFLMSNVFNDVESKFYTL